MIHGHSHGNIDPYYNSIDISIDSAFKLLGAYRPFTETEIVKIINKTNKSLTLTKSEELRNE